MVLQEAQQSECGAMFKYMAEVGLHEAIVSWVDGAMLTRLRQGLGAGGRSSVIKLGRHAPLSV